MILNHLQNGSVEAWTYLVRSHKALIEETVIDVHSEELDEAQTRFFLTLAGQSEPIVLILKSTTQSELSFYQKFAPQVKGLSPNCWTYLEDDLAPNRGWVVLEDQQNHHPPHTWSKNDLVNLMGHFSRLHARYWDQGVLLSSYLFPHIIYSPDLHRDVISTPPVNKNLAYKLSNGPLLPESTLADARLRYSTKRLDQLFRATAGLRILKDQADELGIVDESHLDALERLLINPSILLEPLRTVPVTLLHGQPIASQWAINLFDEYTLINWRRVKAGPNVCDLAAFVEDFVVWHTSEHDQHYQVNGSLEELLLDSYFLALNSRMREYYGSSSMLPTRYLRRVAYPAAVCWRMLTHWLPQFLSGFDKDYVGDAALDIDQDNELILIHDLYDNEPFKRSMSATFNRFLDAYKLIESNPIETSAV